jgi:hypothetical protein
VVARVPAQRQELAAAAGAAAEAVWVRFFSQRSWFQTCCISVLGRAGQVEQVALQRQLERQAVRRRSGSVSQQRRQ